MRICICHRLSIICTSKLGFLGVLRVVMWQCCILTTKRHIPEWIHVFWATAREHLSTGLTCRRWREEKVYKKFKMSYFTTLPRRPHWADFYKSWYIWDVIVYSQFHVNQLNGCDSVRGRILPFPIKKVWSPLTRCCATVHLVIKWITFLRHSVHVYRANKTRSVVCNVVC